MTPIGTKISQCARWIAAGITSTFFVSVFGRMLSQFLTAMTVLVATRFVTLEEFGMLALGQAVTIILTSLLYTGLHHQVLRAPVLPEVNATLFTAQCLLGLAGALFMLTIGMLQNAGALLQAVFLGLAVVPALVGPAAQFEALLSCHVYGVTP